MVSATDSEAHFDGIVGVDVAERDERDQPYMAVSVTDQTSALSIGSPDNYRLHGAENVTR